MKYFGTDGFRGEANVDLNVVHAYKVGRFLGWYYGQEHKAKIVIGKDTRRSSYMFEDALSSGLTASGADVYLLHVTPTPSVSYVVRTILSNQEKIIQAWYIFLIFVNICILHHRLSLIQGMNKHFL